MNPRTPHRPQNHQTPRAGRSPRKGGNPRAAQRINRHKTALHRADLSKPLRLAIEDGLLPKGSSVLDYGCGRGGDVDRLGKQGFRANGWDPVHRPRGKRARSDIVNLGYVVNVIESPRERTRVLSDAWRFSRKALVVAARHEMERKGLVLEEHADGGITRADTFQKFYSQEELKTWIDKTLAVDSVPAAPGVFYAFRDDSLRESVLASRYRRRSTTPRLRRSDVLYQEHADLLAPLLQFVTDRGRLPEATELPEAKAICEQLGTLKRAFAIVKRVTGPDDWDAIRDQRSEDLLVYIALSRFGRRPKFSMLPYATQRDVRALFSSYTRACTLADILLFAAGNRQRIDEACRTSPVGKLTGNALYVHITALPHLAPLLRVYEGCARRLIGKVPDANIIKLHHRNAAVSYLAYPRFDEDAHPALATSVHVNLAEQRISQLIRSDAVNPPILHRKEEMVPPNYPRRTVFATLTQAEETAGLLGVPATIGTLDGWRARLARARVKIAGHSLSNASSDGGRRSRHNQLGSLNSSPKD